MSDPIGYNFGGTDEGSHYMASREGFGETGPKVENKEKAMGSDQTNPAITELREQYQRLSNSWSALSHRVADIEKCEGDTPIVLRLNAIEHQPVPSEYAGNLLAVIHGDGGDYTAQHGWKKSVDDAMKKWYAMTAGVSAKQGEAIPEAARRADAYSSHPQRRADFIAGFYSGVRYIARRAIQPILERERASEGMPGDSNKPEPQAVCRGCGKPLVPANYRIADGCPCNNGRGINHGIVATTTCTCKECDPAQTGSTRPIPGDASDPRNSAGSLSWKDPGDETRIAVFKEAIEKLRAEFADRDKSLAEAQKRAVEMEKKYLAETYRSDEWKREYEKFANAWARELGPVRQKTYLIDALVVGTRELRERAEARADENVVKVVRWLAESHESLGQMLIEPSMLTPRGAAAAREQCQKYASEARTLLANLAPRPGTKPEPTKTKPTPMIDPQLPDGVMERIRWAVMSLSRERAEDKRNLSPNSWIGFAISCTIRGYVDGWHAATSTFTSTYGFAVGSEIGKSIKIGPHHLYDGKGDGEFVIAPDGELREVKATRRAGPGYTAVEASWVEPSLKPFAQP